MAKKESKMIDYNKLKLAHELAEKTLYQVDIQLMHHVNQLAEFGRFFFRGVIHIDGDFNEFKHVDDLVKALQELTQPVAKYKVGDEVWFVAHNSVVMQAIIEFIEPQGNTIYYSLSENRGSTEKDLYPTKAALIAAQIEYWQKLQQKDQNEDIRAKPIDKCPHNVTHRNCPICTGVVDECEHEYTYTSTHREDRAIVHKQCRKCDYKTTLSDLPECQHERDGR